MITKPARTIDELIEEMLEFGVPYSVAETIAPLLAPLIGDPDGMINCYLTLAHRLPHLRFDHPLIAKNLH